MPTSDSRYRAGEPAQPAPPLSRVVVMDQRLPEPLATRRFDAGEDGVTFLGYFLLADGVNAELVFPEAR